MLVVLPERCQEGYVYWIVDEVHIWESMLSMNQDTTIFHLWSQTSWRREAGTAPTCLITKMIRCSIRDMLRFSGRIRVPESIIRAIPYLRACHLFVISQYVSSTIRVACFLQESTVHIPLDLPLLLLLVRVRAWVGPSESESYSGKSTSSFQSFVFVSLLEVSSELSSWGIGMLLP